ncbi:MAG TPA: hypothetical protein GXZ92_01295 [Clostridiales bacterium]|jgi:GR25 family glycosyltransferase involved in LPS biosynthesis|nr:hypothetical protein [Clostridiales bacterium]
MWETIWNMATKSGIWAMLFVSLFFIQLKDSKNRETKYQQTIESLADKLKVVMEIKESVEDIKEMFGEKE